MGLFHQQVVGKWNARGTRWRRLRGTSDSSRFMALDAKTGRLRWNFAAKAYMFSSAALAGDPADVGDYNGQILAGATKTGKPAWGIQAHASKKNVMRDLNDDGRLHA